MEQEQIARMVKEIIHNTDSNFSGEIDYTEYLVAAINKDKVLTRDKLQKTFQSFDLNGDGVITKDEWEKGFGNTKLSKQEWITFLEEIDSNKDGNISMDEFFNFLEKTCIR